MAILAEKYALDYTWYVDTILNLIRVAGDYVSEEVSGCVCVCVSVCVLAASAYCGGFIYSYFI